MGGYNFCDKIIPHRCYFHGRLVDASSLHFGLSFVASITDRSVMGGFCTGLLWLASRRVH